MIWVKKDNTLYISFTLSYISPINKELICYIYAHYAMSSFSWSGVIYRYIFLLNTLSGDKSCLVAPGVAVPPWATETVLSPLVGGWWGQSIARAFTQSIVWWWKKNCYIYAHYVMSAFSWSGGIYRYIFLLNILSGDKSCLVAPGVAVPPWATETVLSPLVGGWWGQSITRAFTRCMMKKDCYIYALTTDSFSFFLSILLGNEKKNLLHFESRDCLIDFAGLNAFFGCIECSLSQSYNTKVNLSK